MFNEMLQAAGLCSGSVYATGVMKGFEVKQMIEAVRAQESNRPMSERIQIENDCYVDSKKAAGKGDFDVIDFRNVITSSIPLFNQPDKGVHTDG
jgi:hypothetical protein